MDMKKEYLTTLYDVLEWTLTRKGRIFPNEYVKPISIEDEETSVRKAHFDRNNFCADFMLHLEEYTEDEIKDLWQRLFDELNDELLATRTMLLVRCAKTLSRKGYSETTESVGQQAFSQFRINYLDHDYIRLLRLTDKEKEALKYACGLRDTEIIATTERLHGELADAFKVLLNIANAVMTIDSMCINYRTRFLFLNGFPYACDQPQVREKLTRIEPLTEQECCEGLFRLFISKDHRKTLYTNEVIKDVVITDGLYVSSGHLEQLKADIEQALQSDGVGKYTRNRLTATLDFIKDVTTKQE